MNSIALTVAVAIAAGIAAVDSGSEWHMVDVNASGKQGDAHLLIQGNVVTLIDAGEYAQAKAVLVPYLQRLQISEIESLFISHPHTDHYKGLDAVVESGVTVKNVYYNMPPDGVADENYQPGQFLATLRNAADKGAVLHDIDKGFRLGFRGGSEIKVLHAQKERQINGVDVSVNDYSLILQWNTHGFRTLFAGDLNRLLGGQLANDRTCKADILKVPHHGASNIAPNAFFDTVAPQLNMFPTPLAMWYSPRVDQAKNWTLEKGIPYCVNGVNGNVVLHFKRSRLSLYPDYATADCPSGMTTLAPGERQ